MKIIYAPTAVRQIESQIAYLMDHHAAGAADRASRRITSFVADFLVRYPKSGRFIPEMKIYEMWIPRTKYVLLYRIEDNDLLRILALFHAAQDRSEFESGM